jgi:hypothetical protein
MAMLPFHQTNLGAKSPMIGMTWHHQPAPTQSKSFSWWDSVKGFASNLIGGFAGKYLGKDVGNAISDVVSSKAEIVKRRLNNEDRGSIDEYDRGATKKLISSVGTGLISKLSGQPAPQQNNSSFGQIVGEALPYLMDGLMLL